MFSGLIFLLCKGKAPGVSVVLSRNWMFAQLLFSEVISEHTKRLYKSYLSLRGERGNERLHKQWPVLNGSDGDDKPRCCKSSSVTTVEQPLPSCWDVTMSMGSPRNRARNQLFSWSRLQTLELVNPEMSLKIHVASPLQSAVLSISFLSSPSPAIKEKYMDWTEFLIHDLTGARTAPANLLEGVCIRLQFLSDTVSRCACCSGVCAPDV